MNGKYGSINVEGSTTLLIVIVCYRVVDLTIDCLRSLAGQISEVPGARVVVCENGTGPAAVEFLRKSIAANGWNAWVTLQAINPNVGFTGGNNAVLRVAMRLPDPPKYFFLLNADTLVQPNAVKQLYDAMEASPEIGIMGTAIVGLDGELQNSCFRDHSPLSEFLRGAGTGLLNRVLFRKKFQLAPPEGRSHYDWVSFASALIRSAIIQDIGLLDEGFFLYFDDADYCRTARKAGWKIGCCSSARVVHLEGQSNEVPESTRRLLRRPKYYYVSRTRYFAKHIGMLGLWAANSAWFAGFLVAHSKQWLSRRAVNACECEWKDIWTNAWAPIRNSNASLIPDESRVIV